MGHSFQPTFVADRDNRLHIEDELVTVSGRAPISVTRCGLKLDPKDGDAFARRFGLDYRHLWVEGCVECRDAGSAD